MAAPPGQAQQPQQQQQQQQPPDPGAGAWRRHTGVKREREAPNSGNIAPHVSQRLADLPEAPAPHQAASSSSAAPNEASSSAAAAPAEARDVPVPGLEEDDMDLDPSIDQLWSLEKEATEEDETSAWLNEVYLLPHGPDQSMVNPSQIADGYRLSRS